jgi:glycosyltransferase involved in cell wall biosynthesis
MTAQTGRIALVSHDTIGDRMAGPGIRYTCIARALAKHVDLTLAIPAQSPQWREAHTDAFDVQRYTHGRWDTLAPILSHADVVICPPDTLSDFPQLSDGKWALAFDDYDPLLSEWLSAAALCDWEWQSVGWAHRMKTLTPHLLHGDFFFCASERQRDWMLGMLEASGRLNPHTYAEDRTLRRLIDIVSTGLSPEAPLPTRRTFRDGWAGVAHDDVLALWGGGLWPWLDPLTAVRAVYQARAQLPQLKLLFPGTRLPNPDMSAIRTLLPETRELVGSLNMTDAVLFGDWLPYEEWPNALLDADIALTLHHESFETRLAFRSRVLDYLWAGLPIVATAGDATAELIQHYGAGAIVPPGDVDAAANAIVQLVRAGRPVPGADFERARRELDWDVVVQPLLNFCRHPRIAPDKLARREMIGPPFFVEPLAHESTEHRRWQSIAEELAARRLVRLANRVRRSRWNPLR